MFIQNRHGQRIAVLVEETPSSHGLVFVMHGLGGFKEQDHIQTMADAFREKGFAVVRFDTTNTLGASDGLYENATVTNYYEDLEDVIRWASLQSWYQEPFVLAGHSLGAMCITLFAEQYPEKVAALAPVSLPVSGQLTLEAARQHEPEELDAWRTTGWQETISTSRPGVVKRLPWSHMEDRLKHDTLPGTPKLTMPILLIVGKDDSLTTPEHIQFFYDALSSPKRLEVIDGAPHTFRASKHLTRLKEIFEKWIASLG